MTQRIAVLMGGTTGERAVSLASGAEIVAALTRLGHEVMTVALDAAEGGLVGSAHAPQWRVGPVGKPSWQGTAAAALEGPLAQVNVFFLGLHGGFGEGGPLQGLLEACGRAFTGSGLAASSLCLDKVLTLLLAESLGLRTARRVVQAPVLSASGVRAFAGAALELAQQSDGVVLKPQRGGSSVSTMVFGSEAVTLEALEQATQAILADGDRAMAEARVRGVEVTASFLMGDELCALPLVEIRPKDGRFFDYEEKYSAQGALEICPAVSLSDAQVAAVQAAGRTLFLATGCRGYARVDFIVPPEGAPVLLEINTLPGMTPRSLFPQAAAAGGLSFDELCAAILKVALSPETSPKNACKTAAL